MKAKHFLFSLFILFISCNKNNVFGKLDKDFDSNRWESKDKKQYEFTIEDDSKVYNLSLLFSHVYDYQFDKVPMVISITDPAGKTENIAFDLQIKDASGKQLADCGGDFCDLKYVFKTKVSLQKGNYTIVVSHKFNGPYLPNVLAVGLNVDVAG
jgi:gliding motility-associated lipoprotein GldH